MSETLDLLSDRARRMVHAYETGIKLRKTLRNGECLRTVASDGSLYTEYLRDGQPGLAPCT
jgi:hypothetical protein